MPLIVTHIRNTKTLVVTYNRNSIPSYGEITKRKLKSELIDIFKSMSYTSIGIGLTTLNPTISMFWRFSRTVTRARQQYVHIMNGVQSCPSVLPNREVQALMSIRFQNRYSHSFLIHSV